MLTLATYRVARYVACRIAVEAGVRARVLVGEGLACRPCISVTLSVVWSVASHAHLPLLLFPLQPGLAALSTCSTYHVVPQELRLRELDLILLLLVLSSATHSATHDHTLLSLVSLSVSLSAAAGACTNHPQRAVHHLTSVERQWQSGGTEFFIRQQGVKKRGHHDVVENGRPVSEAITREPHPNRSQRKLPRSCLGLVGIQDE